MPLIRRRLKSSDVYPDDIRYNSGTDTVQSLVNGDWVDNPAADPRRQTTFPPRLTADPACDAAKSVTDALKNQIDATIEAIGNASTAFQIAGLILGLLSFGVFAIFINIALTIADGMIDAGEAALTAALTPAVYEQLTCILACQFDSNGRITAERLAVAQSEVTDQIGGIAATVINSMLSLAGEGGVNNLASLGTATGNCAGCGCSETWCYDFDFTLSAWSAFVTVNLGTYSPGVGWLGTPYGTGGGISGMVFDFAVSQLRGMEIIHSAAGYGAYQKMTRWQNTPNPYVQHNLVSDPQVMNGSNIVSMYDSFDINNLSNKVFLFLDGAGSSNVTLTHVKFWGTGVNPFGENNCVSP